MLAIERGFIRIRIKPKHTTRYVLDKPIPLSAAWHPKKKRSRGIAFWYILFNKNRPLLGQHLPVAYCQLPIDITCRDSARAGHASASHCG